MRLLACLIVAPQRGYDEPAILSYAISSFCPTSADGLQRAHLQRCLGSDVPASMQILKSASEFRDACATRQNAARARPGMLDPIVNEWPAVGLFSWPSERPGQF